MKFGISASINVPSAILLLIAAVTEEIAASTEQISSSTENMRHELAELASLS